MASCRSIIRIPVVVGLVFNLFTGSGFAVIGNVYGQVLTQNDEPTTEPTFTPTSTPIPTEMETAGPVDQSQELPTETPAEIMEPTATELPSLTITEEPTFTQIPTELPTESPPAETSTQTPTLEVPLMDVSSSPTPTPTPTNTSTPEEDVFAVLGQEMLPDGSMVEKLSIIGPPDPPAGFEGEREPVDFSGEFRALGSNVLSVPAYNWVYGCSAVSASMIAAYYDISGFSNIYTGPANGGVMPMNNSIWPTWSDGSRTYPSLPLAGSKKGVDGRTSRGSIDDYWVQYNSTAPDPYLTNGWTQHTYDSAIGDYMRTSQSGYDNVDGSTTFYNWISSAQPLSCDTMQSYSLPDGTLGRRQFYEARGYTVTDCYNQKTDNTISGGFSFSQFKAEIDSGNPVLLNLYGHSIVGVGYDDASQKVYIHDTWDYLTHEMTWGGSYSGMPLQSVSIVRILSTAPPSPVLISPLIGEITNNPRPVFTWNSTISAQSYHLQVSQDSTFTNGSLMAVNEITSQTSYSLLSPLTTDGIYYWRVAGITAGGEYGLWSTVRSFTLDTIPPAAPALSSPLDNATPLGIPTFSWQSVSGANAYQFQFDNDSDFNSPVFTSPDGTVPGETPVSTTTYKPESMNSGIRFYWHVRSRDTAGNWGTEWSTSRSLIVQESLPAAPALASPAAGFVTNTLPTLTWNNVAGGYRYQVQISATSNFSGTILEDRIKDSGVLTHKVETPLVDGTWYWRVRAINETEGAGDWSSTRSFILDTVPPAAPVPSSPAADATLRTTPTFTWSIPTSAMVFQFEYGTSIDGTIDKYVPIYLSLTLSNASHIPPAMTIGGYYWHARARDLAGNWSEWSGLRKINIYPPILGAPSSLSPATGALFNNPAQTFSWVNVAGAKSYTIQFADTSSFSVSDPDTQTVNPGIGILSYTVSPPVTLHDGIWYWHVATTNATDETGAWSPARTFTLDTVGPAAPMLSLPADNASGIRAIPIFTWLSSTGATAYQFRLDDSPEFDSPLVITPDGGTNQGTPITTTSYKPTGLVQLTTYYWQVRARDAAGNWGDWSTKRTIRILPTIPVAPVITAPASRLITNDTTPTFAWNSVVDGVTYRLQVDNQSTFTSPEIDMTDTQGALTYTPDVSLPGDGIYYWRVCGINANAEPGAWSAAVYFTLDTLGPGAPVLSLPVDNAPNIRGIPTFSWLVSTGANAYQFRLDDNNDFSSPEAITPDGISITGTPLAVSSYKPVGLVLLTPYFWQVRARDVAGNWGEWSVSRTVTFLPVIPAAPVLTSPSVKALTRDTSPIFTWNPVTDGITYQIQVDNLSTFASPEIDIPDTGGELTYKPASPFTADGLYYWRVRAKNANAEFGAWSIVRYFTLDTIPPVPPLLYLPADNASNIRAIPIFSWNASPGATAYQFRLDDSNNFSTPLVITPDGGEIPGTPLSSVSYKPAGLALLKPYFWQVRARDAAGNWGDWSIARTITILPTIPVSPVLTSPAAKSVTNDTTPTFTWNPVTDGQTYQFQLDTVSTFASPDVDVSDTGGSLVYTLNSALPSDGLYYWRVRAVNANNEPGTWSALRYFTLDTTPPLPPILSLPVDNASGIRSIPVFSWSSSSGAVAYQLRIDDSSDFSSSIVTTPDGSEIPGTPLAVTSYKPTGLAILTPYFWQVRARDVAGNWGNWSSSRVITILPPIPAAPVLTSLPIKAVTNNTTPTFAWNAAAGGVTYHFQLDNQSTFASPEEDIGDTNGSLTHTLAVPLASDGLYYWRVRAKNASNEPGAWSAVSYFTLDTVPPPAPILSSPADGLTPVGIPMFYWTAVTGAAAYQFQLDKNNNFSSPFFTTPGDTIPGVPITTTSYKPAGLVNGTVYYWHVRARDTAGNWGAWSTSCTINVQESLPGTPTVISPSKSSLTNDTTPAFTWNAVPGGVNYHIQVDNQSTFSSPEIDVSDTAGALTYTPSIALPADGLYYWRVRAWNATGGAGAWSAISSFTLDTVPPGSPVLSLPANNPPNLNYLPTFSWSAVTGANAYQFQFDDNSDFSSPIFTTPGDTFPGTPLAATSYKPVSLPIMTDLYWHVRARDVAGNWGSWSTARLVRILNTDTDGDSLPDVWEISGYDADNDGVIDVNLPALGASYRHKDIFVEMDYMVKPGVGDLGPDAAMLNNIAAVFNNAPLPNPDGTYGIHIHLQKDQEIPYDADLNPVWDEFSALKAFYFDPKRTATHHYMIWANGYNGTDSSGISRGIDASDFIVSLGLWNEGLSGTPFEKVGTFIHELGHNLNLTHGGVDNENYKPNYLSVMNYYYQTWGLLKGGHWGDEGYPLNFDYQRLNIVSLNENTLNETAGLSGADNITGYGAVYICSGYLYGTVDARKVDWNCDGNPTGTNVKADINGSGSYSMLSSQNNWQNISFRGGGVIGSGASQPELQKMIQVSPPVFEELTWQKLSELIRSMKLTH